MAVMSQIPRRNGWTIAAQTGDRTPDKTQRLLSRAVWDTFAARGVVRRFAGRLAEAIPLFERTLADSEQVLGNTHPRTLIYRSNLARGYHDAGRLAEAIPLFERTGLACAKARGATLRRDLIDVAARLTRRGRDEITLHLPEEWHREHDWMNLFEAATGPPAQTARPARTRSPRPMAHSAQLPGSNHPNSRGGLRLRGDTEAADAQEARRRAGQSDAETTALWDGSHEERSELPRSYARDFSRIPPPDNEEGKEVIGDRDSLEATEVPGEGYGDQSATDGERDRVLARLDEVEHQVDALVGELRADLAATRANRQFPDHEQQAVLDQWSAAIDIRQEVRELREAVSALAQGGTGQDPRLAAVAAAQQAALASDVRDSRKRFRTAAWSRIWQALKKVAPHLWALITRLTRVKEWSVTGQLGGGVLGLASAGITVTFG